MNLLATHFDQNPTERQRYRNSLIGLAAGDAWGLPVEFTSHSKMPSYPVPAPTGIWRVSDDTQMALAVNDALADLTVDLLGNPADIDEAFIARYLDWYDDPDNNRAPGTTCLGSLAAISSGRAWYAKNGARVSRGCGAVMRVAPAAFLEDTHWAGMAAMQAVITHKHPSSVLSALLVADAIRHSREHAGRYVTNALITINAIDDGSHPWCTDPFLALVLEPVLFRADAAPQTLQDYLLEGLHGSGRSGKGGSVLDALLAACEVQHSYHELTASLLLQVDPCRRVGEGWNSPTATALALLVADMGTSGPLTPGTALAWGATSNGDSDSIAAIAGAILGAMSDQLDFWEQEGLTPVFEPRYQRAIDNAPEPSMELGVYPPEAGPRRPRAKYFGSSPAAQSAAVFAGSGGELADQLPFDHYAPAYDFDDEPLGEFDDDYELDADYDDADEDDLAATQAFMDSLEPFTDAPELHADDPACAAANEDYLAEGLPASDYWATYLQQMNG